MKIIKRKVGQSLSLECGGERMVVTLIGHGSPPQMRVRGKDSGDYYVFFAHHPLLLYVDGHLCTVSVLPHRPGASRNALSIGVEAPPEVKIERIKLQGVK